jgi:phospholipase A-2-activating protein
MWEECRLSVSPDGKWVVSGSWDSTARLWKVGKWECDVVLEGHEASVWAVLAYDENTIITACRVRGRKLAQGPDNVV